MIRIGVTGYGYWGPNLVRNFGEASDSRVVAIADLRPERLQLAATRYPAMRVTADAGDLLDSPDIDAIVVSTPVSTHFELALRALRAGKPTSGKSQPFRESAS